MLQVAVAVARLRRAKLHVVHVVYVPATWVDGMTFMPANIVDSAYEAAEAVKKAVWDCYGTVLSRQNEDGNCLRVRAIRPCPL